MDDQGTPRDLGPYRLDALLGRGGMAEVYRAWDQRLNRWVAVKRLSGDSSAVARRRFLREARAAAGLGHPAIIQIFDILEQDNTDWIVMEMIDGPDLATLLQDGPLDVGLILDYGRQIAEGLAAAHGAAIVHRDLKTQNVMVLPSGHVKILDFGLAKTLSLNGAGDAAEIESAVSVAGTVVGTPRAMSPEQTVGREVDFRSDLFALGVMFYELSTTRSPFLGRTVHETLSRVLTHRPPDLRKLNQRVPRPLADLVARLLAKEPDQRPAGAGVVAETLAEIAAESPLYRTQPRRPSPDRQARGDHPEGTPAAFEDGPTVRMSAARSPDADGSAPGTSSGSISGGVPSSGLQVAGPASGTASGPRAPEEQAVVRTLVAGDFGRRADELDAHLPGGLPRLLSEHGGVEVEPDLLLFERPWNALCYALACHQALKEAADTGGTGGARVGIHLGELIVRRQAFVRNVSRVPGNTSQGVGVAVEGAAKSMAARLRSLAGGGQTLLSRAAYDVARRGVGGAAIEGLEWLAHGRYRFKDTAADIEIFEAGVAGLAPLKAPAPSTEAWPVTVSNKPEPKPQPITMPRTWAPPELPAEPYPVLLPYTHPDLLAGREAEIEDLVRDLRSPVLITGLYAPSGTGKSSLLLGGLLPLLRASDTDVSMRISVAGTASAATPHAAPAAYLRHPHEAGVASRLLGDLLEGVTVDDHDWHTFVERLAEAERLAGEAPLLVLDQFEQVLQPEARAARATLGVLLAATARQRPGIDGPVCRWLLAYRKEYHGAVIAWLGDVLRDASGAPPEADEAGEPPGAPTGASGGAFSGIEMLPHDLSLPDRFQSFPLSPLATTPAGGDVLASATRVFQAAIEKPLELIGKDGRKHYPWRFAPGHAERLARAFARARLARPGAPLGPELQVTLAHLLARTSSASGSPRGDGAPPEEDDTFLVTVPEDPGRMVEEALEDHLRRALESAFPPGTPNARTGRAQALLALRELVTATGRRDEGLPAEQLAGAIGTGGEMILEKLATPLTRLVLPYEADDGLRYVLCHDRMAEVVARTVEQEGRDGKLLINSELLALRRFVALKTALHAARSEVATRISRRQYRGIAAHAGALLWNDRQRAWWAACKRRRRADIRRSTTLAVAAAVLLAVVTWGTWSWVQQGSEQQALLALVEKGEPGTALRAIDQLLNDPPPVFSILIPIERTPPTAADLLALLRRREVPMDVLEQGLGDIPEGQRSATVVQVVEIALPWVRETPEDNGLQDTDYAMLIANLVWALDYGPGRQASYASRAQTLRERVLEPLRERWPPLPAFDDDPEWISVPAGTFQMGSSDDEGDKEEHPRHEVTLSPFRIQRHEVTNAEYRLLVPDHQGQDQAPAGDLTWYQATTYAAWRGGRLPTEAEWEYAARAGCGHPYCRRDGSAATVDEVAWTLRNSTDPDTGESAPSLVEQLEPNPWGLHDMLGNLWEWTTDWYGEYPVQEQRDPWGPPTGEGGRVLRGGDSTSAAIKARSAARLVYAPRSDFGFQGFRVVLPGHVDP